MSKTLTLEYWMDDGWFIGRLKEIPSVFSQGETIEELEENIRDAYELMLETKPTITKITKMERRLPFPGVMKSRIACVI